MIAKTILSLKRTVCVIACVMLVLPYIVMATFAIPATEDTPNDPPEVPDIVIDTPVEEPDTLPPVEEENEAPEGTEDVTEEPEEDIKDEPEEETEELIPSITYYDVPLSASLQEYIFTLCNSHGIDPVLIISMIFRESSFQATNIGDSGNSLGLMQIQPRWFQERMVELGITNCGKNCSHKTCLLNPYSNVTLGIDYVAELMSTGKSIQWVLMAYNGGEVYANRMASEGKISSYVSDILSYSESLGN